MAFNGALADLLHFNAQKDNAMPPNREELLTAIDVLRVTGFKSRTTLYRRAKAVNGDFPKPVSIGAGKIRWRSSEIEGWLNSLPVRRY